MRYSKICCFLIFLSILGCIHNDDFTTLEEKCDENFSTNITIEEIFSNSTGTAIKYPQEGIVEGYVISSDQQGNFFKSLRLQNRNGSRGFAIAIDQTDLYTRYNPGRKVQVLLKNMYTEIDNDALEIGALFIDRFSNETVGRIPYPSFENVIIKSCEVLDEDQLVKTVIIEEITDAHLNTLVEIQNIQFVQDALGTTLYDQNIDDGSASTNHLLEDRSGNTIIFRTSAFCDFAAAEVPRKSGTVRGVLTKFDGAYQLLARSLEDLDLSKERFEIVLKNNLFFTELADPNNNSRARFIEIYNAEDEAINLNNWTIRRYTNSNTSVSSSLDLSGLRIESNQAFVIAANAAEFEAIFGFPPDFEAGTNGPADSNGDDNLELVDSQGAVVDIFGIVGEDGTGTSHEFEDGRALRKLSVTTGNIVFTFNEWQIWNDTGGQGTINLPQDAPGSFTPGIR